MSRGLVYPPAPSGQQAQPPVAFEAAPAAAQPSDGFKEKLLKYIPGEVVAFFVPVTAIAGTDEDAILWVALVAGVIAAPVYLYIGSLDVPRARRTRGWAYVLTVVSFLAWAFATSQPTADLIGIDQGLAGVILAVAALFIPAIDVLVTSRSTAGAA